MVKFFTATGHSQVSASVLIKFVVVVVVIAVIKYHVHKQLGRNHLIISYKL